MNYDISVIIPAYNAEKYLLQCVNSIISSSVFNRVEVLLIDDGSKDKTADICDDFSSKYENIKAFHIENGGVSKARNTGIEKSTGKYITFCDADDYYINDFLKNALQVIENNSPDIIFFDFYYEQEINSKTVNYPFLKDAVLKKDFTCEKIPKYMLENSDFNSVWNKFFKKEKVNALCFKLGQKHGEDRDFILKYLLKCETAYYIPIEGYFYRYVKTGAINKQRSDYFDNIENEFDFRLEIYSQFNIPYEEAVCLCEKSVVQQIVACTFLLASVSNYKSFLKVMKKLFANEKLMAVLSKRGNDKISKLILNKKTFKVFQYIKFSAFKEKVYKLL